MELWKCVLIGVIERRRANCGCQEMMIQTVDNDRPPSPDVMLPFEPVLFQHFGLLLNYEAQQFSILRAVSPGHDYNASISSRSWNFHIKRESGTKFEVYETDVNGD